MDKKQEVQAQFGRNAAKYVTSESHAKGSDLDLLVEWVQPQPDWIALDIATGGGHVAKALSPHVAQVFATDLTRPMLAAARAHHEQAGLRNIAYVAADAEALPFLDSTFDLVTCRIAAHHFPNPAAFVAETQRVLKQGGRLLLIDNVAPESAELDAWMNRLEWLRDRSHNRCAPVSEWRDWLAAAGLVQQRSRLRGKTFLYPEWVERTAESPEQVAEVEAFVRGAPAHIKTAFAVVEEGGRVRSHQIEEWMVLAGKP